MRRPYSKPLTSGPGAMPQALASNRNEETLCKTVDFGPGATKACKLVARQLLSSLVSKEQGKESVAIWLQVTVQSMASRLGLSRSCTKSCALVARQLLASLVSKEQGKESVAIWLQVTVQSMASRLGLSRSCTKSCALVARQLLASLVSKEQGKESVAIWLQVTVQICPRFCWLPCATKHS